MDPETISEIYELADEALAHSHAIETDGPHADQVERNLELIRRRTDPAIER